MDNYVNTFHLMYILTKYCQQFKHVFLNATNLTKPNQIHNAISIFINIKKKTKELQKPYTINLNIYLSIKKALTSL